MNYYLKVKKSRKIPYALNTAVCSMADLTYEAVIN